MAENMNKEQKQAVRKDMRSTAWKLPLLAGLIFIAVNGCTDRKNSSVDKQDASQSQQTQQAKKSAESSSMASNILSYMAQPVFIGSNFTRQITGTAVKLEILDMTDENEVDLLYFSIASKDFDNSTLSRLTNNPDKVEFAKKGKNGLELGGYNYSTPGRYLFRFPARDFKVRKDAVVTTEFNSVTYNITVKELADLMGNASIYCGDLMFKIGEAYGTEVAMANHGALVAKSGEPSLKRLAAKLTASCKTKEERAQALLDFVSTEIRYDGSAHMDSTEQLKRPSEVLMTKKADCSGKAILLASLLEQAGVDYRLIYFKGHISVAVEGYYSDSNGLRFSFGKKAFSIAEPTVKNFMIGETMAYDPSTGKLLRVNNILFLQRPGEDSKVYDAKTGEQAPFI